jgi:hypothetical protein
MDKELEFVDKVLDFYTPEDRELLLGKNALRIGAFRAHSNGLMRRAIGHVIYR